MANRDNDSSRAPERTRRRFGVAALMGMAILGAGVGVAAALFLGPVLSSKDRVAAAPVEEVAPTYVCPMHPSVVQDHPGDCPICGMKLVELERAPGARASAHGSMGAPADEGEGEEEPAPAPTSGLAAIDIDPGRQQLIGLKTVEVARGPVGGAWRTVGRVAVDETRVRHVNIKVSGFVERIYVDFVGKKVKKGDPLFSLYSPELLSAQEELLLALRMKGVLARGAGPLSSDGDALVAAARRKLRLWDVPEPELERLARTGEPTKTLTFYSPVAGVVTMKDVVEGMKLDAGAMPYEIVDLSSVWVLADVYESELRFVKVGMGATLKLNAFPEREFRGEVVFVDPLLNPQTRTVKVRLTFPNPTGELRPEMFGEVILLGSPHDGLRVPTDAVIHSGTQKVVFVSLGAGRFQPRTVKLGDSDGAHVEVLAGLAAGDRVVTRANFLVDSESRLRASLAEMASGAGESARVLPGGASPAAPGDRSAAPPEGAGAPPAGHDHRGHRP